jgi:hypothetical protein
MHCSMYMEEAHKQIEADRRRVAAPKQLVLIVGQLGGLVPTYWGWVGVTLRQVRQPRQRTAPHHCTASLAETVVRGFDSKSHVSTNISDLAGLLRYSQLDSVRKTGNICRSRCVVHYRGVTNPPSSMEEVRRPNALPAYQSRYTCHPACRPNHFLARFPPLSVG